MAATQTQAPSEHEARTGEEDTGGPGRLARSVLASPLILVGLLSLAFLVWQVRVELVVLFAAFLFGVSLYAAARWLSQKTGLGHRVSVAVCALTVFLTLGGFFFLTQQRLSSQYGEFGQRLPQALEAAESRLEGIPVLGTLGGQLRDLREGLTDGGGDSSSSSGTSGAGADSPGEGSASSEGSQEGGSEEDRARSMQIVQVTLVGVSRVGLMIILALYMAFDGRRYVHAFLKLFPERQRHVGGELIRGIGTALPLWLLGRISSMAVVAALTAPGLMLLGIPLAFVLAFIAGLFSFVPVLGPIASVVPAILITLDAAPDKILWVLLLYGGIQLVESWFVTPRIQDRMADVPPLLLLSAQFLLGTLVGLVGVMFSTPLALAGLVVVQILYLREGLDEPITLPGAPADA
ncbi:MAG: AI-2E family transporter [Gemmatimonadota bacterium]